MGRLATSIRAARQRGPAVVPFVAAGYPIASSLGDTLRALADAGAAAIEVGLPFSDPIADGPMIQAAYHDALTHGMTVDKALADLAEVAPTLGVPVVVMVSHSIVYRREPEAFAKRLNEVGVAGLLIPDLPPPEAEPITRAISAAGVETVLLVAPSTPPERRRHIAELCTGFVYYLSVAGTTGARADLPPDLAENVTDLKNLTDQPVCVGFGIGEPGQVAAVNEVADAAIVGSALVKAMAGEPGGAAERAAGFLRGLIKGR
jgi:tryptophan synthase alpha chain